SMFMIVVVSSGGISAHPAAERAGRGSLHPANADPPGTNNHITRSRLAPRNLRSATDPEHQPSAASRLRVTPSSAPLSPSPRTPASAGPDRLHVQRDADLAADQHATGLERHVPLQAVVLPVDRRRRRQPDHFLARRL